MKTETSIQHIPFQNTPSKSFNASSMDYSAFGLHKKDLSTHYNWWNLESGRRGVETPLEILRKHFYLGKHDADL